MARPGLRIRHQQNLLFGLFLLALGAAGIVFSRDLDMGSAVNMGPAYLPTILSGCIVAMGIGFVVSGLAVDGPAWQGIGWMPFLIIPGVVVLFGLVIKWAGLAATVALTVIVASLAGPDRRWREVVLFAVGLAFVCVLVFHVLLNLPLPVWPQW
jgi:Tripartite tricarboxylate transporter TctB family